MHRSAPTTLCVLTALGLLAATGSIARADESTAAGEAAINPAVAQLRHAVGTWDATTEFLAPDGSVARSVQGTYEFEWVVPDRVLQGASKQPEPNQISAILFYYEQAENQIGMASVGADGHLWVMTGPADSEVRTTAPTPMPDGTTLELRFTRYNVAPDSFESKMEVSTDGGETWVQGNRQVFVRRFEGGANAEAVPDSPSE